MIFYQDKPSDMLRAIIIEDEEKSREGLRNLLEKFCEGVEVVALAGDVAHGVAAILKHNPQLVFLDIEMPGENGFELFTYFDKPDFDVIFTTAYDQFAVQAFRLSAVDYLLKPIDLEELRAAIDKAQDRQAQQSSHLDVLQHNLKPDQPHKVALPTGEGFQFVLTDDILRCEADGNYTQFFLTNGNKMLVSKTLKEFDQLFAERAFFRAHRSHLINLRYVSKYTRAKAPIITMEDGSQITLAPTKRESFLAQMMN